MTSLVPPSPTSSSRSAPQRRTNDLTSGAAELAMVELDPEFLYKELRSGQRSIESLAALLPLNVVFQWQTQHRLSEAEFSALMAGMEIQEVQIGDLPTEKAAGPDATQQREDAVVAAFKARMAGFDALTLHDVVTELDLKSVLQAKTPTVEGIGIRMLFAKGVDDALAKPGTTPALSLTCRAYIGSTSMPSSVKCEALFSAVGMTDFYCRIVVPLPLHKGGRRRLLVAILDNDTRQQIKLPPAVAELFHESNLFDLRLMRKAGPATQGIGSAVKGAFDRMFHR